MVAVLKNCDKNTFLLLTNCICFPINDQQQIISVIKLNTNISVGHIFQYPIFLAGNGVTHHKSIPEAGVNIIISLSLFSIFILIPFILSVKNHMGHNRGLNLALYIRYLILLVKTLISNNLVIRRLKVILVNDDFDSLNEFFQSVVYSYEIWEYGTNFC